MTGNTYSLECPECGDDVFVRSQDAYGEDEEETCEDCGTRCVIAIDDAEDPPVAYVAEVCLTCAELAKEGVYETCFDEDDPNV